MILKFYGILLLEYIFFLFILLYESYNGFSMDLQNNRGTPSILTLKILYQGKGTYGILIIFFVYLDY